MERDSCKPKATARSVTLDTSTNSRKRWRVAMSTDVISFSSTQELADAMQRAEAAHGEHEKRIGRADPAWPEWYAKYMVAEKAGEELPL
jgi:hypothetical protein